MAAAKQKYDAALKELDELKRSIRDREEAVAREKLQAAQFAQVMQQLKDREDRLNRQADLDRQTYLNDQQKAAEAKRAAEQRQKALDEDKLHALKQDQDAKLALAKMQGELEALKQKQQQAATVVAQPPVIINPYPYYHPYRWGPWGW